MRLRSNKVMPQSMSCRRVKEQTGTRKHFGIFIGSINPSSYACKAAHKTRIKKGKQLRGANLRTRPEFPRWPKKANEDRHTHHNIKPTPPMMQLAIQARQQKVLNGATESSLQKITPVKTPKKSPVGLIKRPDPQQSTTPLLTSSNPMSCP